LNKYAIVISKDKKTVILRSKSYYFAPYFVHYNDLFFVQDAYYFVILYIYAYSYKKEGPCKGRINLPLRGL